MPLPTTHSERLHKLIEAKLEHDVSIPPGLLNGKMGLCIYFYRLARTGNNDRCGKVAERLLDEIFSRIGVVKSINIENGLSGIGMGICYLIRNGYVQGDENDILRDIDDEIFKQICFSKTGENAYLLIQVLLYFSVRKRSLKKEQEYLWNELAIQIVNDLHTKTEQILNDNEIFFRMDSNLPLFLFALGKVYETGLCNDKIERMMREITPFIMSKYGYRDSKRLHLLWGVGKINKHIEDKRLADYCEMLVSQIDLDDLLDEFRSKDMFVESGLAGVLLLMLTLEDDVKQKLKTDAFYDRASKKIDDSPVWKMAADRDYLTEHIGLWGYCGVTTILDTIKNNAQP